MRSQITTPDVNDLDPTEPKGTRPLSAELRKEALRRALRKRARGVPTYSVPEAAALLSISPEYLYRLIKANRFPAVRMGLAAKQGKFIVAAKVVEQILDETAESGSVDTSEWTAGAVAATGGAR